MPWHGRYYVSKEIFNVLWKESNKPQIGHHTQERKSYTFKLLMCVCHNKIWEMLCIRKMEQISSFELVEVIWNGCSLILSTPNGWRRVGREPNPQWCTVLCYVVCAQASCGPHPLCFFSSFTPYKASSQILSLYCGLARLNRPSRNRSNFKQPGE